MLRFRTDGEEGAIRALNQVDHGITSVESNAKSAGIGIKGMFAAAGGLLLGAGIIEGAKGMLMLNANAESAKLSLETVTGSASAANAVFKEIQDFAKATPFEFPELVNASINLESFGMKTMEWLPTIGDTAAAMGKSVDVVVQAVLDASTGEYERLKELGIKARIEGDKVAFSYMKNGEQVTETVDKTNQEMINSTIMGIWNEKYAGAMEKQSASFKGQWSTLKDNASITMMSATAGVFEASKGLLSFANDVFAVGWQEAIDNAFGDSAFGDALSNIGTFTSGIIDAFGEGAPVSEIVKKLPESWQPAATVILTVADSLGDLWSKIENRDFAGFFSQLGEELGTIGGIVISGTLALGGELLDVAGDLWGWLKGKLGYGDVVDQTGGPNAQVLTRSLPFGTILVAAGLELADTIWEGAKDFGGWIKAKIGAGGGGGASGFPGMGGSAMGIAPVSVGDVLISAGLDLAKDIYGTAGDFGSWIKEQVVVGWDKTVDIGEFVIKGSPNAGADGEEGGGFATSVRDAVITGIQGIANFGADIGTAVWNFFVHADWPSIIAESGFTTGESFTTPIHDAIVAGVKAAVGLIVSTDLGDLGTVATVIASALGVALLAAPVALTALTIAVSSFVAGAISGLIFGDDVDFGSVATKVADGIEGAITDTDFVGDAWESMIDALTPDFSGIESPNMPAWMTEYASWLTDPVNAIIKAMGDAAAGLRTAWQDLQFWKGQTSETPPGNTSSRYGPAYSNRPGEIDGEQVLALPGVGSGAMAAPPPMTFTTIFDADTSLFDDKMAKTMVWGETFARQTFESTFSGDTGPAAIAYTLAFGWGSVFANQTFTARFSVDLSPMEAALARVRDIVTAIDNLLPHSPAKVGPLSRKPNWGWLFEGIEESAGRLPGMASRGLSALLAPGLSPSRYAGAAAGGGQHFYLEGAMVTTDFLNEVDRRVKAGVATKTGKAVTARQIEGRR